MLLLPPSSSSGIQEANPTAALGVFFLYTIRRIPSRETFVGHLAAGHPHQLRNDDVRNTNRKVQLKIASTI
jgi:hypothetical protein